MKQHILLSALLFFSVVTPMDKPKDESGNHKLLFPLSGKNQKESLDECWKLVRENYVVQHYLLESEFCSLPREVRQMILHFWFILRNPSLFSSSEAQLSKRMLDCCIMLSSKEKVWNLPIHLEATHDGKYYLGYVDDTLNIYDAKTKKCIRSTDKALLSVCQKENIIMCGNSVATRPNCCIHFLYEIEKNQWHDLGELDYRSVEDCTQCMTVLSDEYLSVWSFANIGAMVCHKIPCVNKDRSFVKLTSDGHIVFGPGDGTIVLLNVENDGLKELARYDSQGLLQSRNARLVHYDESDYLILGKAKSLGIKIEKNNDKFALKEIFLLPAEVWDIVGKDTVLTYALKDTVNTFVGTECQPMLSLMDYTGKIIQTGEFMGTSPSYFAGHLIYGDSTSLRLGEEALTITHVARDNNGYGTDFVKKIMGGVGSDPWNYTFSSKENLFVAPFAKEKNSFGCFDLEGKRHLSFAAKKVRFHPHGHALLCENQDGTRKKLVLHPNGADEHFKKLAHKPLTLAQRASLETLCGKVEELRASEQAALTLARK